MSQLNINTIISILGIVSTTIIVLVKIKPGLDNYFRKGIPILAEIDDIIDAILLEFPNNDMLNTLNDILDKLLLELKQAGYKIDEEDKKKVENRLKAQLQRKGVKLDSELQSGQYVIKYDQSI